MTVRSSRPVRATGAAVVAVGVLVTAACSGAGSPSAQNASDKGYVEGGGQLRTVALADRAPAPELTGAKVGDGELTLNDYRGSVVVVNVWGSWCAPCREETPELIASSKELARSGVKFAGINTRDNEAAATAYERAAGIPYPSFFDPDGKLLLKLRDSVPPRAVPSTLVLDPQGRVAAAVIGGVTQRSLSTVVGGVIREAARASASASASATQSGTSSR